MTPKGYPRSAPKSRRSSSIARKGRIIGVADQEIQLALPIPQLLAATHGAVEALAGEAGLLVIKALIDEEVEQLAGKRYEHAEDRTAVRWGSEEGYVVFAGGKVPVRRPRVRAVDGREVPLQRYGMFRSGGRMQESVSKCVLRGVSTRDYAGVVDGMCDG